MSSLSARYHRNRSSQKEVTLISYHHIQPVSPRDWPTHAPTLDANHRVRREADAGAPMPYETTMMRRDISRWLNE